MKILAIDPGPLNSAFVLWDTESHDLLDKDIINSNELIHALGGNRWSFDLCAIEMVQSYGMGVGKSIFETCLKVGQMLERLRFHKDSQVKMYGRPSIKGQIGGRNDTEIRSSLRMRYGDARKGEKLEGVKKDIWAALALAVALEENTNLKEW